MIRVLVADDAANKAAKVRELANDLLGPDNVNVEIVETVSAAMAALRENRYDLLVLDINIPRRAGEEPARDGGMQLVRTLRNSAAVSRPDHIIGLTEYSELGNEFAAEFGQETWFIVDYSPSSDEWADRVGRKLVHIAAVKAGFVRSKYRCDLAIVTALETPELAEVLRLDGGWAVHREDDDPTLYHRGVFARKDVRVSVVASSVLEMGMPAAAAHAMKVIEVFRPRCLAMVGIAAGVGGRGGDILVADQAWDYGSGKNRLGAGGEQVLIPAPVAIPIDLSLKAKFAYLARQPDLFAEITKRWPGKGRSEVVRMRIGPIASGAAVLENERVIEEIKAHNRKLIGIEMETYGVFVAARACRGPRPLVCSIKSISDFGNAHKNDDDQEFASFTAAQFLYEFALGALPDGAIL